MPLLIPLDRLDLIPLLLLLLPLVASVNRSFPEPLKYWLRALITRLLVQSQIYERNNVPVLLKLLYQA